MLLDNELANPNRWTVTIPVEGPPFLTCRWCQEGAASCQCLECAGCADDVTHGPRVGRGGLLWCSVDCAVAS